MVDIQSTAAEIRRGKKRKKIDITRMWANAQPDGRHAQRRWRPLFNAAVWLTKKKERRTNDKMKIYMVCPIT